MEKIKDLTQERLGKLTQTGKTVLLFSADWCPDCRFLAPSLPEIEQDFPNIKFYEVDLDSSIDLAKSLNVFGIPSFVGYENGQEIGRLVSKDRKTKAEVETFLKTLNK